MELKITHTTRYNYDRPASYALQKTRLCPMTGPLQTVVNWDLEVEGGTHEVSYTDHYGNTVDLINTMRGATEVTITASGIVETHDTAGVLGKIYGCAPLWHFQQKTDLTTPGKGIRALAKGLDKSTDLLADLHKVSADILTQVPYETGATYSATTAEEALSGAKGVCQDHAQIFIATARHAGLPARYVSGYLMMNDRIDQDASHAWAEVHLNTLGWVAFDVSNGQSPDGRYVRIAIGRDARDAAPVTGMRIGSGDESLIVSLQVQQ